MANNLKSTVDDKFTGVHVVRFVREKAENCVRKEEKAGYKNYPFAKRQNRLFQTQKVCRRQFHI